MLILLASAGAAAHADVLDGAAEAGHLVALEVGQADEHVRIHDGAADVSLLDVFAALHRHRHVVRALQAVADEDRAAHGQRREAVLPGALQVLQRILAAAGIHGVAVGQEGVSALFLHQIRHRAGIVRAQEAQVAQLAEVHLDGHELAVHVNLADPGLLHQLLQLAHQAAAAHCDAKIRKINLRILHFSPPK